MTRALAAAVAALLLLTAPADAMGPAPSAAPEQVADYVTANELIDAGRYAEAVPLLEKVVALDPGHADAWSQLGFAMRKSGTWDKSELYYGKALALNPRHEQAMEYLGEMYLESGRPELARIMLDKLATLCPEGCEARSELEVAFEAYDRKQRR